MGTSRLIYFTIVFLFCCVPGQAFRPFFMDEICDTSLSYGEGRIHLGNTSVIGNTSGILQFKNSSSNLYRGKWHCSIDIKPPHGYGVVISLESINFGSVCVDSVTLVSENSQQKYCEEIYPSRPVTFIAPNSATVIFRTGRGSSGDSRETFRLIFTAYRKGACSDSYELTCENGNCISADDKCRGHDQCGDNSNEEGCPKETEIFTLWSFIITIVCLFAAALVAAYFHRRLKRYFLLRQRTTNP